MGTDLDMRYFSFFNRSFRERLWCDHVVIFRYSLRISLQFCLCADICCFSSQYILILFQLYAYTFATPIGLTILMKCLGSEIKLFQTICLYGYSIVILIIITILCMLPFWVLIITNYYESGFNGYSFCMDSAHH